MPPLKAASCLLTQSSPPMTVPDPLLSALKGSCMQTGPCPRACTPKPLAEQNEVPQQSSLKPSVKRLRCLHLPAFLPIVQLEALPQSHSSPFPIPNPAPSKSQPSDSSYPGAVQDCTSRVFKLPSRGQPHDFSWSPLLVLSVGAGKVTWKFFAQ